MVWLLGWRSLWDRPRRTLVLLVGYGIGVAVMIALLSVGDALLAQARDRDLVAGGDLVLLPEGVDPSVLKVNGVTDLYFTIQQAGFVVREILLGGRFAAEIAAAAPQIDARQVYVRRQGTVFPAQASGGVPSLDQTAHATAAVPGAHDTATDRAWIAPRPGELIDRLDRFHTPPPGARLTWAEWDYFNFIDPRTGMYGYLTILAGGEGHGGILVRIRRPGRPVEDIQIRAAIGPGDLSVESANERIGPARVSNEAGQYHITVDDPRLRADLRLVPDAGFYLPAGEIAGDAVISGYVVPAVRGRMSGYLHTARGDVRLEGAPAYHDHNWGTWRGVTWEWGEASGRGGAVLYGGLHIGAGQGATGARRAIVFVWETATADGAAHRGGFLGAFPVHAITYAGWHPGPVLNGRRVRIPSSVAVDAASGADRVSVRIRVSDGLASVAGQAAPGNSSGRIAFLQLRGNAQIRGTVDGRQLAFDSPAAAETFVRP
jgi:hypothetical protein